MQSALNERVEELVECGWYPETTTETAGSLVGEHRRFRVRSGSAAGYGRYGEFPRGPVGGGMVGSLATLSAAGRTLLMLHVLHLLATTTSKDAGQGASAGRSLPWLATAFASVALPWALFLTVAHGSWRDVLAPKELWAALWPIAIGALLAVALRRFGQALPRVPEGDVVVVAERAASAIRGWSEIVERADGRVRRWPVAGVWLLAVAGLLGALAWAR